MIDLSKKNILTDNLTTLEETSYDKANSQYMTHSNFEVVHFDKVKENYIFKKTGIPSKNLRSNDALVILNDEKEPKFIFIEFKNGNLDKIYHEEFEHEKIRTKINESLWILNDILDETLSFDKKNINYILVYNKEKNNNYALKTSSAKKAGKSFLIGGFSRYNVFFHDVKTVNDDEFKKIVSDLENSCYVF